MSRIKELKLKLRDIKNRLTGKQEVIDQYYGATHEIAQSSDKEEDPERKQELQDLYKKVTDEKWVKDEQGGWGSESHDPYKRKKKDTKKKIEEARQGLERIRRVKSGR